MDFWTIKLWTVANTTTVPAQHTANTCQSAQSLSAELLLHAALTEGASSWNAYHIQTEPEQRAANDKSYLQMTKIQPQAPAANDDTL